MTESPSARKDVADLLENLAKRIRTDPSWGAGAEAKEEKGGITVYAGPEFTGEMPALGAVDLFEDPDAITVTAETRNTAADAVKVTLAEDRLLIGLGDGPVAVKREVPLPDEVDEEYAVATFRNGVLDIVLPRKKKK